MDPTPPVSPEERPEEPGHAAPAAPKGWWRRYEAAVLALFLILAYVYVWTVQPGYGPDEPRHFQYVKRLVEKRALPVLTAAGEEDGAHTLHPPLYYALAAPVYLAARGAGDEAALRAIKHLSPLLLLGALLLFLALLRRVFPDRPFAAAAALTVVALLPEFLLEASVMNNDGLAVLLGSLWLWLLVRTWNEPPSLRLALLAGLVMAAFVNTKATGWTLSPLWALAILARSARAPGTPKAWGRDLLAGYGVLLLLGTWWYLRNHQLYGHLVPIDFGPNGELRPFNLRTFEPLAPLEVYTTGYVIHYGHRAAEGLFYSFWTQIDWIREEYRPAVFGSLLALTLAAAGGWLLRARAPLRALLLWKRAGGGRVPALSVSPLAAPAAAYALNWLHTWSIATFLHMGFYQGGRYLMPSVFGAGALLAAGWEALLPARARLPAAVLLAAALLGLNALCLVELVTVLNPKYVR